MTRALRNLCCLILVAGVAATVAPAALADAGIPNYRSKLVAVAPTTKGLTVRVVDGDDALELRNATGKNVMVPGYEGEPYLRFPPGRPRRSQRQLARQVPERRAVRGSRFRKGRARRAGRGGSPSPRRGSYVWHEHRIHWMSTLEPPRVKESDGKTFMKIFDWKVPLKVGADPVNVRGTLWWVPTAQLDRADALIAAAATRQARQARAAARAPRRQPTTEAPKAAPAPDDEGRGGGAGGDARSGLVLARAVGGRGRPGSALLGMAVVAVRARRRGSAAPEEGCGEPVRHPARHHRTGRGGARARLGCPARAHATSGADRAGARLDGSRSSRRRSCSTSASLSS